MGRQKQSSTRKRPSVPIPEEEQQRDSTTFSIRLTEEQRDLVMKAAAMRGWSPTNLIRTASLETAIHILNTTQLTKFNFKGLASEIADQLFKARKLMLMDPTGQWGLPEEDEYGNPNVQVEPEQLALSDLMKFKKASRLGGGEFLNLILDACEALTAEDRTDLPDPVDPDATEE
jgi:uncharacterized protein (DUF1778 family)